MHSWEALSADDKERPAYYAIDGRDGEAFPVTTEDPAANFAAGTNIEMFSHDNCFKSNSERNRWLKVYFNWVYIVEAVVLQVNILLLQ